MSNYTYGSFPINNSKASVPKEKISQFDDK